MLAITSGLDRPSDVRINSLGRRVLLVPQQYRGANAGCGRPRKKDGRPCALFRAAAPWGDGVAPACSRHLSADERSAWDAHLARREAFRQAEDDRHDPACWSWPVTNRTRARLVSDQWKEREDAFFDWHEGRCAICGLRARDALVEDHSHETGMTRGYLCRGCNISEGSTGAGAFRKYRLYPPAFIVNHCREYRSPFGLPAISYRPASDADVRSAVNLLSDLFH